MCTCCTSASRVCLFKKRWRWFSQIRGEQIQSRCRAYWARSRCPVRPHSSAARGSPQQLVMGRWCAAGGPIGRESRCRRGRHTAPPSVARTVRAAAGRPTTWPRLHTEAGSSSAPRTVCWDANKHDKKLLTQVQKFPNYHYQVLTFI